MSHKHIHNSLPKVHSYKVWKIINDPELKSLLNSKININHDYEIPYIAGYSLDGKTVYIDKHFYPYGEKEGLIKYLLIHERTEKFILDKYHMDYQQAHHIATHMEEEYVKNDGLNWRDYADKYIKWIKELNLETLMNVPKDLDLTPYKDEHDLNKIVGKINEK